MARYVWEKHFGKIPNGYEVNHKDCNPKNNAIENLELVTHRENCQRKKIHLQGKQCGYSWDIRRKAYKSQCFYDGKNRHLGYYTTPEQAIKRYWDFVNVITNQQEFDF